jgi:hypothetical protein
MSKILAATCVSGVVKVGSLPVDAEILSEGVASSSGVVVLEDDQATYIAKTSPDLKTTLEKIASALGQLVTALTAIDAKPVGGSGSAPAPGAAANIAALTVLQTEVNALKAALK